MKSQVATRVFKLPFFRAFLSGSCAPAAAAAQRININASHVVCGGNSKERKNGDHKLFVAAAAAGFLLRSCV